MDCREKAQGSHETETRMDTDVTGGTLHLTAEARWTQSGRPYGVELWRASFGSLSCIVSV